MAGNAGAVCDVCLAMFVREYLSVVSRWARQQLRTEVQSAADRRRLRQLIEAADALSADLRYPALNNPPDNVIRLADHRPKSRAVGTSAHEKQIQFLDI
ncbi:MAG: hypothetical protein NT015_15390 [Alphaproteobacteria bacterium]|nr:hypothetical protein [Alphaproteobacteria bacterium]